MLGIYSKLLLKKWYFLIGVVLFIIDKMFNLNISKDILYMIVFIIFIGSSYLVWKDERKEKLNILQSKKYLSDISEVITNIKKLYQKTFTNDYDEKLERQINILLSDLNIIYRNDFLDNNQYYIIKLEISSLIKIMKNKTYKKSRGYDTKSGQVLFEIDQEIRKKYLDYLEQINKIIEV